MLAYRKKVDEARNPLSAEGAKGRALGCDDEALWDGHLELQMVDIKMQSGLRVSQGL